MKGLYRDPLNGIKTEYVALLSALTTTYPFFKTEDRII